MTFDPNNPQAEQMADDAMLRTLSAQAEAIWPMEQLLLERYQKTLPAKPHIIDVACGTGEFTRRLGAHLPAASLVGIDIHEAHLERARRMCADLKGRATFQVGDAFQLAFPDNTFDLVACRHLLQAVPRPNAVVEELIRVCRPGGWVHLVAEDYAQMFFHPTEHDIDEFWRRGAITLGKRTGTDLRSGRTFFTVMHTLGLVDVRMDYITIDTVRVPREVFARIWEAWRDGYSDVLVEVCGLEPTYVEECWAQMLACIREPSGYGVWHLPVISGRLPESV